jgi:flagellar basal body rod protein FlgC
MSAAMSRMNGVASKVASGDMDVAGQAVTMAEAKISMRANAAVIRTTNQMMGTLLDILG